MVRCGHEWANVGGSGCNEESYNHFSLFGCCNEGSYSSEEIPIELVGIKIVRHRTVRYRIVRHRTIFSFQYEIVL